MYTEYKTALNRLHDIGSYSLIYSMTSGCIRTVSYILNCGFARVNIYENTPTQKGCYGRRNVDNNENLGLNLVITLDMESLKINLSQLEKIKGANLRGIVIKSLMASEN